jgi:hypothetical protein
MKRVMISLLGALAFAAAAQTSEPQVAQPSATAETAAATQDEAKKPDVNERNCLRQTGTRISSGTQVSSRADGHKDRKCTGANGRAYTREDLERTGEVDIADALRKLDPSIH